MAEELTKKTENQPINKAAQNSDATDKFTVLGVWIANWADLFPWLAIGHINKFDIGPAETLLKKQCMIQDLLTLSKLYKMIEGTGIRYTSLGFTTPFIQIAESFSQQFEILRDDLTNNDTSIINKVLKNMTPEAEAIYRYWDKIKLLRNAELGLGLLSEGKSLLEVSRDQEVSEEFVEITLKMETCAFQEGKSYSPFSKFFKLMPLITPNDKIYVFGPANMLLVGINEKGARFSKNGKKAMEFKVTQKTLSDSTDKIKLFPIPFDGAKGVSEWKGQSFSTNLGSDKTLQKQLSDVSKNLEKLNMFSFGSNNWKKWKPGNYYSINSIKTQYVGIVEPVGSVFKKQ